MATPYRKFNTISAQSGAIYRKFNTILSALEIIDTDNDFRMAGMIVRNDIDNDFRMTLIDTFGDVTNDFRMGGNIVRTDIDSDIRIVKLELQNLLSKFNTVKEEVKNITNDFRSVIEVTKDFTNIFYTAKGLTQNIDNDIRTVKLVKDNIENDFRMQISWQTNPPPAPGEPEPTPPQDPSFKSLGKKFIKVYINSVEQTDVNVDSINISKIINGAHIASFDLARAYDGTKPNIELPVEIKYHIWTLYKGYITIITPTSNPESMKIACSDEYWKKNKTKKYFYVGHKPLDDKELYYNTIQEALSTELSFSAAIGNFIPQHMDLFAIGESNSISTLVSNAGTFGWFYKQDGTKNLWGGGQGSIITLSPQTIGVNVSLYDIIRHQFSESIENIINKLKVQMGEEVVQTFDDTGGTKTFTGTNFSAFRTHAQPAWDTTLERLAKNSVTNYGYDYHKPEDDDDYKEVFKVYALPYLDSESESWTDRYQPILSFYDSPIEVLPPGVQRFLAENANAGYTIDYKNKLIIFSQPQFKTITDSYGIAINYRRKNISITIWKKQYLSSTASSTEDPETESGNALSFFTDKIGDFSETVLGFLGLTGLSVQEGFTEYWWKKPGVTLEKYYPAPGYVKEVKEHIPSWDDTDFALDFANWQVSKTADKKVTGFAEITLDAFLFYNIDLSNRIMIDNVLDNPLNINSININMNNFTVTLNLESYRNFKRSINIPTHGE